MLYVHDKAKPGQKIPQRKPTDPFPYNGGETIPLSPIGPITGGPILAPTYGGPTGTVNYRRTTLFGHYCLADGSPCLSDHFGCVDTCAAKGNRLTAYRWDGEATLDPAKFTSVPV